METRIRMLNVTYMRYIEQHFICFIPGKVLDEINRLLSLIENRFDPPHNNNQLLEELRDLSSMAMEHFDEHISPRMEKHEEAIQYKNILPSTSKPVDDEKTQKELRKIHKRNRYLKSQLTYLVAKSRRLSEKWYRQNLRVKKQSSIIKEQNGKLQVQATRLENHEMTILEMKKKFEELQTNFVEIKSKWDSDALQNTIAPSASVVPLKHVAQEAVSSTLTKNLKILQYESMRQRVGTNKSVLIKTRTPKKTEDTKKRRFRSMVDIDIWRRRCPTSRLSYVSWYKDYPKTNLNKSKMMERDQQTMQLPSTSKTEKNKKESFPYKTIIKQRNSRVFPLSCLDLERKRKSYLNSEIPTKLSKNNETDNKMKAFDLLKKFLPRSEEIKDDDTANNSNVISCLDIRPMKRKRENSDA